MDAKWQRRSIRCFCLVMAIAITLETIPDSSGILQTCKVGVEPWLRYAGLWQGRWTLFAPNPGINNAWLSADIEQPEGEPQFWNSTFWAETNGWQRFFQFRHINYNSRIQFQDKRVADDMADYLATQLIGLEARTVLTKSLRPVEPAELPGQRYRLRLFRNQLNISLPDDGTLPTREETTWISSSESLTEREYVTP